MERNKQPLSSPHFDLKLSAQSDWRVAVLEVETRTPQSMRQDLGGSCRSVSLSGVGVGVVLRA